MRAMASMAAGHVLVAAARCQQPVHALGLCRRFRSNRAITLSRHQRKFHPLGAIEMPSLTVMVPNVCGIWRPPPARQPRPARSKAFEADCWQGDDRACTHWAMPMIGLSSRRREANGPPAWPGSGSADPGGDRGGNGAWAFGREADSNLTSPDPALALPSRALAAEAFDLARTVSIARSAP